ncbi:MAG TPA: winged helix-turn-helix transcriptional regulator, partial [Thermoplasmata archaeon]|nr:winged helix-turn-helix transcriptional regulator [Thermoplasmata archaeon]
RRLPPLVPPFYTRLRRRDIVGHRARHEILRTLERNPGLSLGSLIENVGDSRSTVMYHLRVLEKEGLVRSTREGRARRYFPESMPVRPTIDLEEAIIETIARNPGVDITHVANELGTSKQLVSYHVQKLSRSSRLWAERDGRRKRLFPRETQPPSS